SPSFRHATSGVNAITLEPSAPVDGGADKEETTTEGAEVETGTSTTEGAPTRKRRRRRRRGERKERSGGEGAENAPVSPPPMADQSPYASSPSPLPAPPAGPLATPPA